MEKLFNKWIAVDWGTTSFRAYLIENEEVLLSVKTDDGMERVTLSGNTDWLIDC